MPGPPKGTPKPPGSGRKPGSINKRTAYRQQVEAAMAEGRKVGKGILVAVEQLEIIAARYLSQAKEAFDKKDFRTHNEMMDRAARVLKDLAPYQTPKLAAVTLKGDPKAPLNLSGLSDGELAFMRNVLLKVTSGYGED